MIVLETCDTKYLQKSWEWLHIAEIKYLTNTSDFTLEDQKIWYEQCQLSETYKIWGVSFDQIPIGLFGIKNIDPVKRQGEYWGYIGEKQFWGKGIGSSVLKMLIDIAKNELHLNQLYLKVIAENARAISLYEKYNFKNIGFEGNAIIMMKNLQDL